MLSGQVSPRILHTMIRVADLQRSLDFYAGALGMKVLRQDDYTDGRFTLAFLGYDSEASSAVIELTIKEVKMSVKNGSCGCGKLKYSVEGEPINSLFCYCKECQIITGSDKWFGVWVPKDKLKFYPQT